MKTNINNLATISLKNTRPSKLLVFTYLFEKIEN